MTPWLVLAVVSTAALVSTRNPHHQQPIADRQAGPNTSIRVQGFELADDVTEFKGRRRARSLVAGRRTIEQFDLEENEGSGGEIVDGARPTTVALGGVKLQRRNGKLERTEVEPDWFKALWSVAVADATEEAPIGADADADAGLDFDFSRFDEFTNAAREMAVEAAVEEAVAAAAAAAAVAVEAAAAEADRRRNSGAEAPEPAGAVRQNATVKHRQCRNGAAVLLLRDGCLADLWLHQNAPLVWLGVGGAAALAASLLLCSVLQRRRRRRTGRHDLGAADDASTSWTPSPSWTSLRKTPVECCVRFDDAVALSKPLKPLP